jgi:electron transport complex protein RnfB
MLPHANCGACGFPGCRPFAEAVVSGAAKPGKCTVSSDEGRASASPATSAWPRAPRRSAWRGWPAPAAQRGAQPRPLPGAPSPARRRQAWSVAAARAAPGVASASATASAACTFDAIRMDGHGLPGWTRPKCTACGDCVSGVPEGPVLAAGDQPPAVGGVCKSQARRRCSRTARSACTACGRCAMDAAGLISMHGNLPVVDYTKKQDQDPDPALPHRGHRLARSRDGPVQKGTRPRRSSAGRRGDAPDLRTARADRFDRGPRRHSRQMENG